MKLFDDLGEILFYALLYGLLFVAIVLVLALSWLYAALFGQGR